MFSNTQKIIHLMGPTASGKTDLALELAKDFPIEIVSVDSALVYRGLDIGSAKPTAQLRQQVPHYLIDIISPETNYSVATFLSDAKEAIEQIQARGKIPALVGGTMLYFKALIEGLADIPAVSFEMRQALEERAQQEGLLALYQDLQKVDPSAAARIHGNDVQRLIRALEVYYGTGQSLTEWLAQATPIKNQSQIIQLSLIPQDRAHLHAILATRFHRMLEQGFVDEVRALKANYVLGPHLSSMRCVGYRQVWQYLAGEIDEAQMIFDAIAASRQLAKRQLTWLRNWPNHHVIPAYQPDTLLRVKSAIAAAIVQIS